MKNRSWAYIWYFCWDDRVCLMELRYCFFVKSSHWCTVFHSSWIVQPISLTILTWLFYCKSVCLVVVKQFLLNQQLRPQFVLCKRVFAPKILLYTFFITQASSDISIIHYRNRPLQFQQPLWPDSPLLWIINTSSTYSFVSLICPSSFTNNHHPSPSKALPQPTNMFRRLPTGLPKDPFFPHNLEGLG